MSNYLENKILDHMLGVAAYTAPTSIYMALFNTNPTDAGTGTEVSGTNYARVSCKSAFSTTGASSGSISNSDGAINFPTAGSGGWTTANHWALFDAATGGNLLFYSPLDTPRTVASGQSASFAVGACTINMAATDSLTTAGANLILNHVFGKAAWSLVTPYIALHTANPGESGTGAEVANLYGYARKAATFGAASGGTSALSGNHTFNTANGGSWGTITHAAIWSSGTYGSGTCLLYWDITDVTINNGDTYSFANGSITVSID